MTKNFKQLFSEIREIPVPVGLLGRVVTRVNEERRYSVFRKRFFVYSAISLMSMAVFVYSVSWLSLSVAESGFGEILGLLGTDFGIVISSWQSYSLSLLETAPVASLTFLLSSFALLMYFARFFLKNSFNLAKLFGIKNLKHNN